MSTLPTLSVGDDEEEEYAEGCTTDKQPLLIQMDQQSTSDIYMEEAQTQEHAEIDTEQSTAVIDETESEEKPDVISEQEQPVKSDFCQQVTATPIPQAEVQKVRQVPVNTRLPDPMDSGVFDDSSGMFTTGDVSERLHGKPHQEVIPEEVCPERIEAEKAAANKWRPDENMDSGLISDADLHMISAT
jgi:hypothetical protein